MDDNVERKKIIEEYRIEVKKACENSPKIGLDSTIKIEKSIIEGYLKKSKGADPT